MRSSDGHIHDLDAKIQDNSGVDMGLPRRRKKLRRARRTGKGNAVKLYLVAGEMRTRLLKQTWKYEFCILNHPQVLLEHSTLPT